MTADEMIPLLREIAPLAQLNAAGQRPPAAGLGDPSRSSTAWSRRWSRSRRVIRSGSARRPWPTAVAPKSCDRFARCCRRSHRGSSRWSTIETTCCCCWASPAQHEVVAQMIRTLEQAIAQPVEQSVRVYPLGQTAPSVVTSLLDPRLIDGISVIPDTTRNVLIVRAPAERHEALSKADRSRVARLAGGSRARLARLSLATCQSRRPCKRRWPPWSRPRPCRSIPRPAV